MRRAHLVPLCSGLVEKAGILPRVQLQGVMGGWMSRAAKAVSRSSTGSPACLVPSAPAVRALLPQHGFASCRSTSPARGQKSSEVLVAGGHVVCQGGLGSAESPRTRECHHTHQPCVSWTFSHVTLPPICLHPHPRGTSPVSLIIASTHSPAARRPCSKM